MHGKWIGNLTNDHFLEEGDQSSYFGLTYNDCDEMSLEVYKDVHPNHFLYTTAEHFTNFETLQKFTILAKNITKRTVIVFEWEILDASHNYVVFDYSNLSVHNEPNLIYFEVKSNFNF